ncbi:LOW QUALITY PROTEIN: hypothetical protein PanWU01x14_359750, partial [Parasponia andersonii]
RESVANLLSSDFFFFLIGLVIFFPCLSYFKSLVGISINP